VGFVFKHFSLMEALTASEHIELALTFAGMASRARRPRARKLLDQVVLWVRT